MQRILAQPLRFSVLRRLASTNVAGWAVKLPDRVGKRRPFPAPLFRLFYQVEIRYSQLLQLPISQRIATSDLVRLHRNYGAVVAHAADHSSGTPTLRRPAG
jgi:hypothetical protein